MKNAAPPPLGCAVPEASLRPRRGTQRRSPRCPESRLLLLLALPGSAQWARGRQSLNTGRGPRKELTGHLLNASYDASVPPHEAIAGWEATGQQTVVNVAYENIHQLLAVEKETGASTFSVDFVLSWHDPRLVYNGTAWFDSRWRGGQNKTPYIQFCEDAYYLTYELAGCQPGSVRYVCRGDVVHKLAYPSPDCAGDPQESVSEYWDAPCNDTRNRDYPGDLSLFERRQLWAKEKKGREIGPGDAFHMCFGKDWTYESISLPSVAQVEGSDNDHVWTPVIEPLFGSQHDGLQDADVEVFEDGTVWWSRQCTMTLQDGSFKLSDFPFDVHHMVQRLGRTGNKPWGWDGGVVLRVGRRYFGPWSTLGEYHVDTEGEAIALPETWEDAAWGEGRHFAEGYGTYEGVGRVVAFRFAMFRDPTYYIVNVVFPVSFMVLIQSLAFWLPLDEGERVSYAATIFLTVVAIVLFTAELRPATSEVTWLDVFQGWSLLLCFFPLVLSTALLWVKFQVEGLSEGDVLYPLQQLVQLSKGGLDTTTRAKPGANLLTWLMKHGLSVKILDGGIRFLYPILLAVFFGWLWRPISRYLYRTDEISAFLRKFYGEVDLEVLYPRGARLVPQKMSVFLAGAITLALLCANMAQVLRGAWKRHRAAVGPRGA